MPNQGHLGLGSERTQPRPSWFRLFAGLFATAHVSKGIKYHLLSAPFIAEDCLRLKISMESFVDKTITPKTKTFSIQFICIHVYSI